MRLLDVTARDLANDMTCNLIHSWKAASMEMVTMHVTDEQRVVLALRSGEMFRRADRQGHKGQV
jgi:hypothetical protein